MKCHDDCSFQKWFSKICREIVTGKTWQKYKHLYLGCEIINVHVFEFFSVKLKKSKVNCFWCHCLGMNFMSLRIIL